MVGSRRAASAIAWRSSRARSASRGGRRNGFTGHARYPAAEMPQPPSNAEPTPQRLTAIRDQLKLLADYL